MKKFLTIHRIFKKKITLQNINLNELKGLLGILISSAAMKNNHLLANNLFDISLCSYRYCSTMSLTRFNFLVSCLRFDSKDYVIDYVEV